MAHCKETRVSPESKLQQAFIFSQAFMHLCALRNIPVGNEETRATAKIWKELKKMMTGKKAMSSDEERRIGPFVAEWRGLQD